MAPAAGRGTAQACADERQLERRKERFTSTDRLLLPAPTAASSSVEVGRGRSTARRRAGSGNLRNLTRSKRLVTETKRGRSASSRLANARSSKESAWYAARCLPGVKGSCVARRVATFAGVPRQLGPPGERQGRALNTSGPAFPAGLRWTTTSPNSRFCSRACRTRYADPWRSSLPVLSTDDAPRSWLPRRHPARRLPMPRSKIVWVAGACSNCGVAFVIPDGGKSYRYCSPGCARRQAKDRRRATKKLAFVADVSPWLVFQRDGWRCMLCRKKVGRRLVVPAPLAPVVDHIIPLAAGGTHEPRNVQTAHFICNSLKSDGVHGEGEQLRLIG